MERDEIIKMVEDLSLELVKTGEGYGVIYECLSGDEIIEEFGHLSREEIIKAVRSFEGIHNDLMREALAASGEYDFPEGGQPVLKPQF